MMLETPINTEVYSRTSRDTFDGRSDLFVLGCVMYDMLTGEVAFAGPIGARRERVAEFGREA